MNQKRLSILLSLGLDKDALEKASRDFEKFEDAIAALTDEAKELEKAIKKAAEAGQDTRKLNSELEKTNRAIAELRKQGSNVLAQGFIQAKDAAAAMRKEVKAAERDSHIAAMAMREAGEKMASVGNMLTGIGASISTPIMGALRTYLVNNPLDETSRRWMAAQEEIQKSYQRIGTVAADELLPAIEAAADLVDSLADFVEKNPELIKAALVVAGGFQLVGTGLQLAGAAKMLTGTTAILTGGKLGGTLAAGGKVAAGFLTSAGGAVLGGVGLGLAGYQALAHSEYGRKTGLADLGQYASVAAYGVGSLFSEETAKKWFLAMGEMTGAIEKQTEVIRKNADAVKPTIEQLTMFGAAQDATAARIEFERKAEQERTDIVREQGEARALLEMEYETRRAIALAEFAKNESRIEADHYAQRTKFAQQYNIEMQRMEEDHQREMRRKAQEHNARIDDLVASRDALGIVKEQQAYERERRQAESDYELQARRRNQDFARQIAEMEQNFAAQRARRQEDMAARLAEMDRQHAAEVAKNAEHTEAILKQLDERNAKELAQLRDAETKRWQLLTDIAIHGLTQAQRQEMELTRRYLIEYQNWLLGQRTIISGGRAGGGYVDSPGVYSMAEFGSEFVLSNPTTRAAERLIGGKLTQEEILKSLAQRQQSNVINLTLPGGLVTIPLLNDILDGRFKQFGAELTAALEGLA